MAVMWAGLELKKINSDVIVPEKIEGTKINNDIINVPKIPGTEIKEEPINLQPETPNQKDYDSTVWVGIYPTPKTPEVPNDPETPKNIQGNVMETRALGVGKIATPDIVPPQIPFPNLENLVPNASPEFQKFIDMAKRSNENYIDYWGNFNNELQGSLTRINKGIENIQKKAGELERAMDFSTLDWNEVESFNSMFRKYFDPNIKTFTHPQSIVTVDKTLETVAKNGSTVDFNTIQGAIKTTQGYLRWEGLDFAINASNRTMYDPLNKINRIEPGGGINTYEKSIESLGTYYRVNIGNMQIRPDLNLEKTNKYDIMGNSSDIGGLKEAGSQFINENGKRGGVQNYQDHHFEETKFQNKSVYYLLSSGADFINNMFDIAVMLRSNDHTFEDFLGGDFNINDNLNRRFIKGHDILIRTSSIDVPQIENETYTMNFLFHKITKVRSKIKYERKANLKILSDEPLLWRRLINSLSGTHRGVVSMGPGGYGFDNIPERYYPGNLQQTVSDGNPGNSIFKIDILVKHESLLNYPYLSEMKQAWRSSGLNIANYAELRPAEYPIWWFRDVKFMGESTGLQFDRDGTSTTELTFPFIFLQCIKLDRQAINSDESGTWVEVPEDMLTRDPSIIANATQNQGDQNWMRSNSYWKTNPGTGPLTFNR